MLIKDKNLKAQVKVAYPDCAKRKCYHPHPDYGSYQVGRGYRRRDDKAKTEWLCVTRENFGCPDSSEVKP